MIITAHVEMRVKGRLCHWVASNKGRHKLDMEHEEIPSFTLKNVGDVARCSEHRLCVWGGEGVKLGLTPNSIHVVRQAQRVSRF